MSFVSETVGYFTNKMGELCDNGETLANSQGTFKEGEGFGRNMHVHQIHQDYKLEEKEINLNQKLEKGKEKLKL